MSTVTAETTAPVAVEPLLVDARGLAKLLCCSVRSVWRLNTSGKTPNPVRVGRSVRWSMDTIRTWIAMGCPDRQTFEARLRMEKGAMQHER